jgi:serine/threonine-protein kinase
MPIRCHHCGETLEGDARFCGVCGASLGAPVLARVIANRYILRERIGSGSLGVVYRAEQLGVGRKVAIKLLPAAPDRDEQSIERFRRESELLCKLTSPHTVTTFEYGQEPDGSLYIVMELSSGTSLAELMRENGQLPWPRALRILVGLCDSLGEAHALGIVHRDIKPENILVEARPTNDTFVKLLDFGLAKILPVDIQSSPPGQMLNSIEYNSPEQLLRRPLDARSDIYALGVLGFRIITGYHPHYEAHTLADLVAAHVRVIPPLASTLAEIPAELDAVLAQCLAKDPNQRYFDAASLSRAITPILATANRSAGDEPTLASSR